MTVNGANSYVGIGTTGPTSPLTVSGTSGSLGTVAMFAGTGTNQVNITGNSGAWGMLLGSDPSGTANSPYHGSLAAYVINVQNAPLYLGTNNSAKVTINGSGSVGINTLVPNNIFDVTANTSGEGNAQAQAGLRVDDGTNDVALLEGVDNSTQVGYIQTVSPGVSWTNRYLVLQPNGGNVGIGTASPGYTLDVETTTSTIGTLSRVAGVAGSDGLEAVTTGASSNGVYGWATGASSNGVYGNGTADGVEGLSSAGNGVYGVSTTGVGGYFASSSGYGLIVNGGNVGINTASPTALLYVQGGANNSGTTLYINNRTRNDSQSAVYVAGDAASQDFVIQTNGNVGIGTTSPIGPLEVYTNGNALDGISIRSGNAGNYAGLALGRTADDGWLGVAGGANNYTTGSAAGDIVLDTAGGKLMFGTSAGGATAMTILPTGYVGIGTTSPSYLTHIHGASGATQLYINDGGGAGGVGGSLAEIGFGINNGVHNIGAAGETAQIIVGANAGTYGTMDFYAYSDASPVMRIEGEGYVGIGTTSPSYPLDVNGNVRIQGTTLYTGGTSSNYGSITIDGSKSGWSGINFKQAGVNQKTLMIQGSGNYSGIYNTADNGWDWLWTGGTLNVGQIPAANVNAGSFGAGNFTITGTLTSGAHLTSDVEQLYGHYIWPGRNDGSGVNYQTNWYLGSNSSYGLYTNTGMYFAGAVTMASSLNVSGTTSAGVIQSNYIQQTAGNYIYPGLLSGGNYQGSYYLASSNSWGLYTNTSMYFQAGIYQGQGAYIYPGRNDGGGNGQQSWYLASNSTYGLATNTGFYAAGPLYTSGNVNAGGSGIFNGGCLSINWGGTCNWNLDVNGNAYIQGPIYSTVFYDAANTGYYTQPSNNSSMYEITVSYLTGSNMLANIYGAWECLQCVASGGWYTYANVWSDRRLKRDIRDFLDSSANLDLLMKLKPIRFRWKDAKNDEASGEQIGFIAQDVEQIYPELVQ
ncbi:MAG TPA: tail fiber domain-containing protein [Stellaceae bacterium]|jgi:hypothetical protein|nr:tail fiber domain-containing protein [Stellaceae bacterium]